MKQRLEAVGVLLVVASIGLCALFHASQHRLILANCSGQTIRVITISVGGTSLTFNNVKSGASVSGPFSIRGDDHFQVRGELADQTKVDADCGYVTNGMYGERARFTIGANGNVEFNQGRYGA
ncbi:MAG: hypothetical protein JWN70_5928 [Planctomycetaceae bacterium]|nr:hypothetical protein [Planctomycetaceae bacterium]